MVKLGGVLIITVSLFIYTKLFQMLFVIILIKYMNNYDPIFFKMSCLWISLLYTKFEKILVISPKVGRVAQREKKYNQFYYMILLLGYKRNSKLPKMK